MPYPTVTVEVKMSDELKSLCDRIPDNMAARLAEIERVLTEICNREEFSSIGIAFNPVDRSRTED